jgi:hypothetical protein
VIVFRVTNESLRIAELFVRYYDVHKKRQLPNVDESVVLTYKLGQIYRETHFENKTLRNLTPFTNSILQSLLYSTRIGR